MPLIDHTVNNCRGINLLAASQEPEDQLPVAEKSLRGVDEHEYTVPDKVMVYSRGDVWATSALCLLSAFKWQISLQTPHSFFKNEF